MEVYDLSKDPHQLKNIVKTVDKQVLVHMNKRLVKLSICAGPTCKVVDPFPPWTINLPENHKNENTLKTDSTLKFKRGHVSQMDQS